MHIWMELYMWENRYRQFKGKKWNRTCGRRGTNQKVEPYMWEIVPPAWVAESNVRWCILRKKIWSGSLVYKGTLEKQYFIDSALKGEVISSKIDRLVAFYASKFEWAWQAQFLSHTLQILEINLFFEAVKMILLYLIKISFSFWYKKMETSSLSIYRDLHG